MSRVFLIVITLFLFQCTSQRASNNYLFRGVNNPKAKKANVKVGKSNALYQGANSSTKKRKSKINHKSLYKGSTTVTFKKNVKTSTSKSLYKSTADPPIYTFNPKKVSDIQYGTAYKVNKKGKKNKKHFRNKKNWTCPISLDLRNW